MNLSSESKVALVTGAAGASATVAMTHIAIQEALNGKVVEWMEKVSDDQYAVPGSHNLSCQGSTPLVGAATFGKTERNDGRFPLPRLPQ